MTGFAGTGQLSKLAFRRDGAALPACVFGIAALLAITARDLTVLYPTAAGRLAVAREASANPALRFLLGRLNGTSVGAFLAARWSVWGAAFAVLLTIFIVVRHTRGDEEAGRLELVGSAAVGRQAPLTAALLAAATANLAIALRRWRHPPSWRRRRSCSPPGGTTARDCCQTDRDGRPPLVSCMVHSAWRGGCSGLC
jgi:ABC-2 type transport system permease protein